MLQAGSLAAIGAAKGTPQGGSMIRSFVGGELPWGVAIAPP
jgi:hypothetical protein